MKKLAALICGTAIAFSSVCSATIAPDKIAIDRAVPGMSVNQLIAIYGQPVSRHGDDLIFRDFRIEVDEDRPGIVEKVETRVGSMATPDGVSVGQDANILTRVYGRADKVETEWKETEYEYYSDDYSAKLEFTVANGVITRIKCKVRD